MAKETFYFSHDYYARKDPRCIALIQDFGMSGYGMYWCLIEIMYEQGGRIAKFPSLYSSMAKELGIELDLFTKQIEAMLHDYNLLQANENYLWSASILERLSKREDKRQVRAESGRLGGIKSGESRRTKNKTKQNEAPLQANEANEPKKRKEKESKEYSYSENCFDFFIKGIGEIHIDISSCDDWQKKELENFITKSENEFQTIAIGKPELKVAINFQRALQRFVSMIQEQGDYKDTREYKRYFSSWLAKINGGLKKIIANGDGKKTIGSFI